MNKFWEFVRTTLIGGVLIVLPVTLLIIVFLKAVVMIKATIAPVTRLFPETVWFPGLIAAAILLAVCFFVGLIIRTSAGKDVSGQIETKLLQRVPGYMFIKNLIRRLAGVDQMKLEVALTEVEGGLVPSFIVERHADGQFTVFVPSVPTPTAGSIYILPAERVHIIDVPFTKAVSCISRWGSGTSELLAALPKK